MIRTSLIRNAAITRFLVLTFLAWPYLRPGSSFAQDFCTNLDTGNFGAQSCGTSYPPQGNDFVTTLPFCGSGWSVYYRGSCDHSPNDAALDFNKGNDQGEPVLATADGTVVSLGYDCVNDPTWGGYGVTVRLSHANGYHTRYAHLECGSTDHLRKDMVVTRGTKIGTLGNTGASSGAHLHYEVTWMGEPVYAVFDGVGELRGDTSNAPYLHTGSQRITASCDANNIPSPPSPPGGAPPGSVPPAPRITRAFAPGSGTANPNAWAKAYEELGGVNEIGLAVETPHWEGDAVVQKYIRPRDGVQSVLVHDERGKRTRAILVQDGFAKALQDNGGIASLGPPLGNKYELGGSAWRQDFRYAYLVIDGAGARKYAYPNGITPGQGSATSKSAYEAAYADNKGDFYGNPAWTAYQQNGYEFQEFRQRDGKIVRMYVIPGNIRAYALKGKIYDAFMAQGNTYGAWGPPISDEYDTGGGATAQWFRYGYVAKNAQGVVTFAPKSRQYAPGEGMNPDHAVHIIEAFNRTGGPGKLGACSVPYNLSGFAYQYCSGGAYDGRALIVLNHAANNTVAHVVRGSIEAHYAKNGGLTGTYGVPQSDEYVLNGKTIHDFARKSLEWVNATPRDVAWPFAVGIGEGAPNSSPFYALRLLANGQQAGKPRNAVRWWSYQNGTAMVQDYENGSYVYDEPDRAARAYLVKGGIKKKYDAVGGPKGSLGSPVTDEVATGTKAIQYFEFGVIEGDTATAVYQDRTY